MTKTFDFENSKNSMPKGTDESVPNTKLKHEAVNMSQLSPRELRETIQQNLKKLCNAHHSVSHICRQLDINRQQFAKYLDGRALPSLENAIRIADYFGITTQELINGVDDEQKVTIISGQPRTFEQQVTHSVERARQASSTENMPQDGFYLSYNNSFRTFEQSNGQIVISLIKIQNHGKKVYYQRREYPFERRHKTGKMRTFNGEGYVIASGLHIEHVDANKALSVCFISLKQKSFGHPDLCGIQVARAYTYNHEPAAARIYWRYKGKNPNIRNLMKKCRFYARDHPEVDSEIVKWLCAGYDKETLVLRGA